MGKLLKLLNKYVEEKDYKFTEITDDGDFFITDMGRENGLGFETIISKKFGFVKRLVENNKIKIDMAIEQLGIAWYYKGKMVSVKDVAPYEQLIILLAISDTPIDLLCSILK